jgi:hypothetical protein
MQQALDNDYERRKSRQITHEQNIFLLVWFLFWSVLRRTDDSYDSIEILLARSHISKGTRNLNFRSRVLARSVWPKAMVFSQNLFDCLRWFRLYDASDHLVSTRAHPIPFNRLGSNCRARGWYQGVQLEPGNPCHSMQIFFGTARISKVLVRRWYNVCIFSPTNYSKVSRCCYSGKSSGVSGPGELKRTSLIRWTLRSIWSHSPWHERWPVVFVADNQGLVKPTKELRTVRYIRWQEKPVCTGIAAYVRGYIL